MIQEPPHSDFVIEFLQDWNDGKGPMWRELRECPGIDSTTCTLEEAYAAYITYLRAVRHYPVRLIRVDTAITRTEINV